MTVESIYYNKMFGDKSLNYRLTTRTEKIYSGEINTRYFAHFDDNFFEVSKEEYDYLLAELNNNQNLLKDIFKKVKKDEK